MISHHRPPWRFVPSRYVPPEIIWGERFLYASMMVWAGRLAMIHGANLKIGSLVFSCALILAHLALISAAIRGRNLRVCLWLVALVVGCAFIELFWHALETTVRGWRPPSKILRLMRLIQVGFVCVGFFLIFTKRGHRWLKAGARAAQVHEDPANMAGAATSPPADETPAKEGSLPAKPGAPDGASRPA
jgi:hypothetical protein